MTNNNLKTLSIVRIRESKKIPQRKLGHGICKGGTLCEIESGLTIPDFFLLEALVERCGETLDHYSILISRKEYLNCDARKELENKIFYGELKNAELKMQEYELQIKSNSPLHQQHLNCMKALLQMKKGDIEESLVLFFQAIKDTQPGWSMHQMRKFRLSSMEIRIICCIFFLRVKKRETESFQMIFDEMTIFHEYLNENYESEKLRMKFYPSFASVYAELSFLIGKTTIAEIIMKEEKELSKRNGGYSWCINLTEDAKPWMKCIYREPCLNGLSRIFFQPQRGDKLLIDETIKEGKLVSKSSMVQLELCGLDRTSLSKIISGKRIPRENTYMQIAHFLGIRNRKISGVVISQEPRVEELALKIQDALWMSQCEGLEEEIKLLHCKLDLKEKWNQEYIDCLYYFYWYRKNKYSKDQLLNYFGSMVKIEHKKLELRTIYSMEGKDFFQLTVLIYSYIITNKKEKARQLLEITEARLTNTIIKPAYRYRKMVLLYVLNVLANRKEFESVCYRYIKKGIALIKETENAEWLGYFFYFYWEINNKKSPHSRRECREILQWAHKIGHLNQQTKLTTIIEEQYQIYYDKGVLEKDG